MPRQILFIQGGGESVHEHWDNKLVESLERKLGPDYQVCYPAMPGEGDPQYSRWKSALEREFAKLDQAAILVGHSIGGTVLINVLADEMRPRSPAGIFLVSAPFVGTGGRPSKDIQAMSDVGARLPTGVAVYVYHGSEDKSVPFEHVDLYEKAIPQAVVRRLSGRDHQLHNDLSEVAADIQRCAKREL